MNYIATVVLAILLLLSACSVTQETGLVTPRQELVKVSSLPAPIAPASAMGLKLGVQFRVLHDGTVAEVRVLKSGGDQRWDSTVVEVMKQWRFSMSFDDTASGGHWYHYLFDVHIGQPLVLTLGELVAAGQQEADSLYELLNGGLTFASVRGRFLGAVSIETYPERVRNELRKLHVNDFTHPLRLGKDYVIFMRFEDTKNLPQ
jgi:TonB family protein